jgi:parallel beta-helix repeat protein
MKKELIVVLLGILLIGAVIQVTAKDLKPIQENIKQKKLNEIFIFDVGVGFPSDILYGQTRYLGEDNFFVSVQNNGDGYASVYLDFLLERYDGNEWDEIDSGGNGPYDLDPDVWIESFFDVSYDSQGAYRATFSLDSPRSETQFDWSDDNPENDVFQVMFFVINPYSSDEWYVDDDAPPGGDGSVENPFQTISEAIINANPRDRIWVMDGTYNEQLNINKENLDISSFYKSPFFPDNEVIIEYNGGSVVIINEPFTSVTGFVIKNCGSGEEDAAIDITSDYNFISWNIIEENGASGIYLHDSSNNNCINHNIIQNNGGAGLFIWQESLNNWIYHNDFINNNWYNVKDKEGGNVWDYLYPYGGNYWDDYSGTDDNGDGIGDTPYEIMGDFVPTGYDNGPWIEPHKWNDHSVIKKINGPSAGEPGTKYGFEFSMADENFGPGSDPFEEHVYCKASWGDGDEEILGPFNLDTNGTFFHTWSEIGEFTIKAKLTDGYGLVSPEYTFEITIPRSRSLNKNPISLLFNRYINLFPILRILFQ